MNRSSSVLNKGFTLIEMVIVVVLIGILVSIAYPSYQEYIIRSNRTEGMAILNDAAARQERYFAQNNLYITAQSDITKLGVATTSSTGKYSLALSKVNDDGGYTLTATPQGSQTRDTKCGSLVLNALGTKSATAEGASVDTCWR